MEVARVNSRTQSQFVTQQEAAEMIELWTEMSGARDATLVSIQDVKEVLQISDADAQRLLAAVRPPSVPLAKRGPSAPLAVTIVRYFVLAFSMFCAGAFVAWTVWASGRGLYVTSGDKMGAFLCAAWCIGWIWYYRRPVSRAVFGFINKIVQGEP